MRIFLVNKFERYPPGFWLVLFVIVTFSAAFGYAPPAYGKTVKYWDLFPDAPTLYKKLKVEPGTVFYKLAEASLNQGQWGEALAYSRRALTVNPQSLEAHGVFGVASGFVGDMSQAHQEFQLLKENQCEDVLVSLLEAILKVEDGKHDQARKALNKALKKKGDHLVSRYYSGWMFLAAQEVEAAEKEFKRVLNLEPVFALALAGMGEVSLLQDEPRIAARFFDRAVGYDPENLMYHQRLIEVYQQEGAIAKKDKAVQRMNLYAADVKEALLQKGRKLLRQGAYRKTVKQMDSFFSIYQNAPEAYYFRAVAFANLEKAEKARRDLGSYLLERWGSPEAHHFAGMCFLAMEDVGAAEEQFKEAVFRSPAISKSFLPLIVIEQMRGNYERAQEGLTLALAGGESPPLVHFLMAQTSLARGDWNAYGQKMSQAVGLIPGLSGDVLFTAPEGKTLRSIARDRSLLVLYFINSWYGKALEASNRLTRVSPEDLFAWYYRALVQEIQKQPEEAKESFVELVRIQPSLTAAYFGLGRIALETDDFEEAEAAFQKTLAINPQQAEGHVFLGDLRLKRGEIESAVESYRRATVLEPWNPQAYARLSRLFSENRSTLQEAVSLARKAEYLAPEDPYSLDAAGWTMVLEGKVDEGMQKVLSAQKKKEEDPVILYHLAYAFYQKKDFQAARQTLERAFHFSTKFQGADRALDILKKINAQY